MSRPPLPPFNGETAAQKARRAEDAWNSRDPARVALAYTLDYRLIKEVWTFAGDRIAVRFAYEWHDDSSHCVNVRSANLCPMQNTLPQFQATWRAPTTGKSIVVCATLFT
jgi:nuclear transport factor 2 (NTF2) superfamily protein